MNELKFCPICGGETAMTFDGGRKWGCSKCDFKLYNNVASAVGLVIQNEKGEIFLEKRAKEPRKGFLALPGGFCDPDETAEEACFRECVEEIGVRPLKVEYLCSFPNTYEYNDFFYKTCDLFFIATIPTDAKFNFQENEVQSYEWRKIESEKDIDETPLAFESAKKTLKLWLKSAPR